MQLIFAIIVLGFIFPLKQCPSLVRISCVHGNKHIAVRLRYNLVQQRHHHLLSISRKFVAATDKPVFLAGGLHPGNVGAAISTVAPYGVDLCSGVRTDGGLDRQKLQAFMAQVDGAP